MAKAKEVEQTVDDGRSSALAVISGWAFLAALLFSATVFTSAATDSFRLPQGVVAGFLLMMSAITLAGSRLLRSGPGVVVPFARSWGGRLCLGLIAAFLVAAIFSTRPEISLPTFFRALPLLLAVPTALALGRREGFDRAAERVILVVGVVNAVIALLQATNTWTPVTFLNPNVLETRTSIIGLVGNTGTLSLVLLPPFAIALLRTARGSRPMMGVALLLLAAIVATATLTAALGVGVITLIVGWYWISREKPARGRLAIVGILLVVAVAGSFALPTVRARVTEKVAALKTGSVDLLLTRRLAAWQAAVDMFQERPVFGSGLGTFGSRYYELRVASLEDDPALRRSQSQRLTFGEAHNEWLQLLGEGGLAAAVPLLVVGGLLLFAAIDRWRDDPLVLALLGSTLVCAIFQFPFQTPSTAVALVYFAGRAGRGSADRVDEAGGNAGRGARFAGLAVFLFLLLFLVVWTNQRMRELRSSIRIATAQAFVVNSVGTPPSTRAPMLRQALWFAEHGRKDDPQSVLAYNAVAAVWHQMGDMESAERWWKLAHELEPRVDFEQRLAEIALEAGRLEEAKERYDRVFLYDPARVLDMDDATLERLSRPDLVRWKRQQPPRRSGTG